MIRFSRKSKRSRQSRISKKSQKQRMVSRVASNNRQKWSINNQNNKVNNLLNLRKQISENVKQQDASIGKDQEEMESQNEYESA